MNEAQKAFAFDLLTERMTEHRHQLDVLLKEPTAERQGAKLTLEQYLAFIETIRRAAEGPSPSY
jgi:hypothetical protein